MIITITRTRAAVCALLCGAVLLIGTPIALFAQDAGSLPEKTTPTKLKQVRSLTDTLQPAASKTVKGKSAASSSPEQQLEIAKKRAKLMEEIAQKDPQAFLQNAISPKERAKLPSAIRDEVEERAMLTGTVEVLHIDDFKNERNSRFAYHLNTEGERLALYVAGNAPALLSGSTLEVRGYRIGNNVVVEAGPAEIQVLKKPQPESVGTQSTLIILITQEGQVPPKTKDQMKRTIFTGNFEKYYEEQSYGKIKFAGDVTDWISVPPSALSWCGEPSLDQPEVKHYVVQHGIDLSRYGRLMFVNNGTGGGCASVGKWDIPFNGKTYRASLGWTGLAGYDYDYGGMTSFEYVLAHEMGHEIGVLHANAWMCSGPTLDEGCYHEEYGNSFDVMGRGYYAKHFNAFYKDLLGWLPPASKIAITKTGSYSLSPIEGKSGVRAAIITNPTIPLLAPLYLEFRQPIGFDSILPTASAGIHINQVISDFFPFSRLINASYALDSRSQPALMPGGSFTWQSHGISLGSVRKNRSQEAFSVSVQPVECMRGGFNTTDVASRLQIASGSSGFLSFMLANTDRVSCSSSTLTVATAITGSGGWSVYTYPDVPFTLAPGNQTNIYVSFWVPVDVVGTTTLTITITDTTNNRSYMVERTIYVSSPSTIESIDPTRGLAGSLVTLKGTGFNTEREGTNSILITNADSNAVAILSGISSPLSDHVSFYFPSMLDTDLGKGVLGIPIPTPPGEYYVALMRENDGVWSNTVSFEVLQGSTTAMIPFERMVRKNVESQLANVFSAIGADVQNLWAWAMQAR